MQSTYASSRIAPPPVAETAPGTLGTTLESARRPPNEYNGTGSIASTAPADWSPVAPGNPASFLEQLKPLVKTAPPQRRRQRS